MGFGILFVGYLTVFLFSISPLYFVTDVLGCLLMAFGLVRLSDINRYFKYTLYASLAFLPFSVVSLIATALKTLGFISTEADAVILYAKNASCIPLAAFTMLLLTAVHLVCKETGLVAMAKHAVRNRWISGTYYALYITMFLTSFFTSEVSKALSMPTVVLMLLSAALNCILLFGCYMRICRPDDVDMEAPVGNSKIYQKLNSLGNLKPKEKPEAPEEAPTYRAAPKKKKKRRK